jgi:hypothetical protein
MSNVHPWFPLLCVAFILFIAECALKEKFEEKDFSVTFLSGTRKSPYAP